MLGRALRVVAVLAAFGLAVMLQQPISYSLSLPWGATLTGKHPVGLVAAVILASGALIGTFGAAWALSRGTTVEMGKVLEAHVEYKMYRLRLMNRGARPAKTRVKVERVVDTNGNNVVPPAVLPLELEWTHHPKQSLVEVPPYGEETVAVVMTLIARPIGRYFHDETCLILCGAQHNQEVDAHIPLDKRQKVHLLIAAERPNRRPGQRWFALAPDFNSPDIPYSASTEKPGAA